VSCAKNLMSFLRGWHGFDRGRKP